MLMCVNKSERCFYMSSVQGVSFGSSYIIPINQVKNSETMRQLGIETQKFVPDKNDITYTKDGIVVKVDDAKDKEYEAVIAKYGVNIKKFEKPKNTPNLTETQANLNTPKITPTGTPIIRFTDKNGEQFMAREVKLENSYVCMAVSNVKDPKKAELMNKDVFNKLISQEGIQIAKQ